MSDQPELDQAAAAVDRAAEEFRAGQEGRLTRSRFAQARETAGRRVLELLLEDRRPHGYPARLELDLGGRGAGGPIVLRIHSGPAELTVEISEAELRAIAITCTAALAWTAKAPAEAAA